MAEKIKGLTYIVDIDGSKFEGGMKEMNQVLSATKREMNQLDKALKLDPSSVELLTQKMKKSEQAITLSKVKITEMEDKLKKLKSAEVLDHVKIARTQADLSKLVVDLKKIEKEKAEVQVKLTGNAEKGINELNKDLKKINGKKFKANVDIDEKGFSNKLQSFKKGIASLVTKPLSQNITFPGSDAALGGLEKMIGGSGAAMAGLGIATAGVGAAVVGMTALAKKSWEAWNQVDDIIDKITNLNTATTDIGNSFENLASKNAVGLEETGNVILGITKNFKELNPEQIENFGNKLSDFTQYLGGDPVSNAKQYKSILSSFGQDTSDVNVLNDKLSILASGIQAGSLDAGEFMQAFDDLAPSLATAGFSIEQSTDLITRLSNAGLDASDIQNGLAKATIKAAESGKPLTDVLNSQIKALSDGTISTQDMNNATDLFGKKGALSMINALKNGRLNLEDLGTEFKENINTLNDLETANADAGESFATLGNKATLALSSLGDKIAPSLGKMFDGFASFDAVKMLEGMTGFFSTLGQMLGDGIKGLVTHPEILLAVTALPSSIVLSFIDGLISSFAGDEWKQNLGKLISDGFNYAVAGLSGFFTWAWNEIVKGWEWFVVESTKKWNEWGNSIQKFFQEIPNKVAGFGIWLWNGITGGLSAMGVWLWEKISSFGQSVSNGFQSIPGMVAGFGVWIWGAISSGLSGLGGWIWNSVSGIGNNVASAFQSIPGKIGDLGGMIWNSISGGLNALWDKMWRKFDEIKNMAGDAMNKINPANWFRYGAGLDFGFHTSILASVGRLPDGYTAEMRSLNAGSSIVNNSVRNITQRPIFNVTVNASNDNDVKKLMNEIQDVLGGLING